MMCVVCSSPSRKPGSELCPPCYACIYPHRERLARVSDLHRYHPPVPTATVLPFVAGTKTSKH